MSRRFKAPKAILNMGSPQARLRKCAERIKNQAQLDMILSQVEPRIGEEWLKMAIPHLRFKPLQCASLEKEQLDQVTETA